MSETRNIVVVEDSQAQAKIVARLLSSQDAEIRICTSSSELAALGEHQKPHPQAVFLDMHLGNSDGAGCIPLIQRMWPRAVIVAMTADSNNSFNSLARARSLGADLVLRKPFNWADVAEILQDVDSIRTTGARRRHVLVIDDSAVIRQTISRFFDPGRFRVVATHDARDVLLRLNFDKVDVLVTDLTMPDMSGEEIIQLVREVWPDVRVVAMSGTSTERLKDAGSLGAHVVLKKPFSAEALLRAVENDEGGSVRAAAGGALRI